MPRPSFQTTRIGIGTGIGIGTALALALARHWHWPGTGTGTSTGPALALARHWHWHALARHWHWPGTGIGTALARHWHWHWHWPGTGPALARHAGLWLSAVLRHSLQRQPARIHESPAEPLSPHFRMVGCGAQDQLHRRLADGPVVVPVCRQRQLDPLLLQVPTVPSGARDGCAMPFRPTHSMHAPLVCAGRSAQSLVGAAFTFSSCSAIVRGATTSAAKTSTATTGRSTRRQSRPSLSLGSSDGRCCLPLLPVRVPHRCSVHRRQMRPINGQRATRASRAIGR